jgi:hypothetical protein
MKRFDIRAAVDEELARFEEEVRTLAYAIARAVLREELESKPLQLVLKPLPATTGRQAKRLADEPDEPIAPRAEPKATRRKRAELADEAEPAAPEAVPQLELQLANAGAASDAAAAAPPPAPAAPAPQPRAPEGQKRVQWTRESIINELATWVSSGTAIDAAFMARHGPRGLVAAARKIFGRFEAAMNLTALHLSKVSAENPPSGEPS